MTAQVIQALEDEIADLYKERKELLGIIYRAVAYVEDPGNWSALDGRRRELLSLLMMEDEVNV